MVKSSVQTTRDLSRSVFTGSESPIRPEGGSPSIGSAADPSGPTLGFMAVGVVWSETVRLSGCRRELDAALNIDGSSQR